MKLPFYLPEMKVAVKLPGLTIPLYGIVKSANSDKPGHYWVEVRRNGKVATISVESDILEVWGK